MTLAREEPNGNPSQHGRLPHVAECVVLVFLGGCLWLGLFSMPTFSAGEDLDASWQQAYGYFLEHGFQAGADYVLTYGPLGYFYTTAYDPDLYWHKFAWEVGVKLLMSVVLMAMAWQMPRTWQRLILATLFIVLLPERAGNDLQHRTDASYFFFLIALALLPLVTRRRSLGVFVACAGVLALFSFLKFTLAILGLGVLAAYGTFILSQRRYWALTGLVASYVVTAGGLWLYLGQQLNNLPGFLAGSWEVSEGFVEGMAYSGPEKELYLALALLALCFLILAQYARGGLFRLEWLGTGFLLFGSLFVIWKYGFVRHDIHSLVFFSFMPLVPWVLPLMAKEGFKPSRLGQLLFAGYLVAGLGSHLRSEWPPYEGLNALLRDRWQRIEEGASAFFSPGEHRARLQAQHEDLARQMSLPAVRDRVGRATIDQFPHRQGLLFLNGLSYRPRPIFQSYSAYTPGLMQRNAAFYRSENAPEYVLFAMSTIDNRLPPLDDGPALLEILRRYRPVDSERSLLLLQRRDDHSPMPPAEAVREQTVQVGEEVLLSAEVNQFVQWEIDYSLLGQLAKMVLKPPPFYIELTLDEQEEPVRYRLIPGMARAGCVLNPLLRTQEDVARFYQGERGTRVRSFRLLAGEGDWAFTDRVRVRVREGPNLAAPVPSDRR